MFEVKAAAKIPESVFVRAGYSANASIVTDSREGVLTLPESTIQFEEGKPCVYILTSPEESPEQTFEKRDVTLGLSTAGTSKSYPASPKRTKSATSNNSPSKSLPP